MSDDPGIQAPCRRFFLFGHSCATSNLFLKILGENPDISKITYPFHNAFKHGPEPTLRGESPIDGVSEKHLPDCEGDTYQQAYDAMMAAIAVAEKDGKIPFITDQAYFSLDPKIIAAHQSNLPTPPHGKSVHTPTIFGKGASAVLANPNPTLLPDQFLRSVTPIFLFRHPARFVPSFYRAAKASQNGIGVRDSEFPSKTSLRWLRLIFDWYAIDTDSSNSNSSGSPWPVAIESDDFTRESPWPIVIESDDFIREPRIMQQLCVLTGLDPHYLQYEWDAMPPAKQQKQDATHVMFDEMLQTLKGVRRPDSTDWELDLAEERAKFVKEFGADMGGALADYVDVAMPEYYYLRCIRCRV